MKTFLHKEFQELESYFDSLEKTNTSVSLVPVAWHLDHILRATLGVTMALIKSDTSAYKYKFNAIRTVLFALNFLPRGRAKAPKATQSTEPITVEALEKLLAKCKEKVLLIDDLEKDAFFNHMLFGSMNKKTSKRFIQVHLHHHLKIIRDILKK